jgi:hypothetical protein
MGGAALTGLMWKPKLVLGNSNPIPKRILFVHGSWGAVPGAWEPLPSPGNQDATETAWQLNELFAPLEPYRDRMNFFENLDMVSAEFDSNSPGNAHYAGSTHEYTADRRTADGEKPATITIDQFIAKALNEPEPQTPLRSMHLYGSGWKSGAPQLRNEAGLVPSIANPQEAYDLLFPPRDNAEIVAARDRVFSHVEADSRRLRQQLSSENREKLRQHLQTRSDIERRLNIRRERPDASLLDPWSSHDWDYPSGDNSKSLENWSLTTRLNSQLIAAAMHADVTRVATLGIKTQPISNEVATGFEAERHHALEHQVMGAIHDLRKGDENDYLDRHPEARQVVVDAHRKVIERLRELLDDLDSRVEPDGQSLLDHTLVVYTSQIADSSHSLTRLPWCVIGDMRGFFNTGRYVPYERTDHPTKSWKTLGRPHNDLFVSLAQAMDVDIQKFGNPDVCTGRISEIHRNA